MKVLKKNQVQYDIFPLPWQYCISIKSSNGCALFYEGNVMIDWFIFFFASCAKDMAQIWNLIIVKKFNESIAIIVTSMDWCGLNKDIKFSCNTFHWVIATLFLIVTMLQGLVGQ